MKLIIVGDSSVLFNSTHNIAPENTYGFILKSNFKLNRNDDVFIIGKKGNDTQNQCREERLILDIIQFDPKIVIIHLGINDCSLYSMTKAERLFINSVPKINHINTYRIYKKIRYIFLKNNKIQVKIKSFKLYYEKILNELKNIGVKPIIINILNPPESFLKKKRVIKNIKEYNNVLFNLAQNFNCKLIDLYSLTESQPSMLINNTLYLSKYGHMKLADVLISQIESLK